MDAARAAGRAVFPKGETPQLTVPSDKIPGYVNLIKSGNWNTINALRKTLGEDNFQQIYRIAQGRDSLKQPVAETSNLDSEQLLQESITKALESNDTEALNQLSDLVGPDKFNEVVSSIMPTKPVSRGLIRG